MTLVDVLSEDDSSNQSSQRENNRDQELIDCAMFREENSGTGGGGIYLRGERESAAPLSLDDKDQLAALGAQQKLSSFSVESLLGAPGKSEKNVESSDFSGASEKEESSSSKSDNSDDVDVIVDDDEDDAMMMSVGEEKQNDEDDLLEKSYETGSHVDDGEKRADKRPRRDHVILASEDENDFAGKDDEEFANSAGYVGQYRSTDDAMAPYGCLYCDKMFSRLSYLKRHEQVHSDAMPYQCDYCQRYFKHKRSRDRHVRLHTGDKRYACNICTACFSRSDHLKIHLKTHNSTKPFQCLICSRGYTTMAALTAHTQSHHRDSTWQHGDLLRCLRCTAVFRSAGELHKHTFIAHTGNSPATLSAVAAAAAAAAAVANATSQPPSHHHQHPTNNPVNTVPLPLSAVLGVGSHNHQPSVVPTVPSAAAVAVTDPPSLPSPLSTSTHNQTSSVAPPVVPLSSTSASSASAAASAAAAAIAANNLRIFNSSLAHHQSNQKSPLSQAPSGTGLIDSNNSTKNNFSNTNSKTILSVPAANLQPAAVKTKANLSQSSFNNANPDSRFSLPNLLHVGHLFPGGQPNSAFPQAGLTLPSSLSAQHYFLQSNSTSPIRTASGLISRPNNSISNNRPGGFLSNLPGLGSLASIQPNLHRSPLDTFRSSVNQHLISASSSLTPPFSGNQLDGPGATAAAAAHFSNPLSLKSPLLSRSLGQRREPNHFEIPSPPSDIFSPIRSSATAAAAYGNPSSFYSPRALFSDPYQALAAADLQKKNSAASVVNCPFCPPSELNTFESIQALHKHCLTKHQNQQINNNNNINIINKQLSPLSVVPHTAELGHNKNLGQSIKKIESSPKIRPDSATLQNPKDSLSLSLHVSTDSASERTNSSSLTPVSSGSLKSTSSTSPTSTSAKKSTSSSTEQDCNQSEKADCKREEMSGSEEIACALCAQLFHSEEQVRLHVEMKHSAALEVNKFEHGINECAAEDSRKRSHVSSSSGSSTFAVDNLIQKDLKRSHPDLTEKKQGSTSPTVSCDESSVVHHQDQSQGVKIAKVSPVFAGGKELTCCHCFKTCSSLQEFQLHLASHLESFLRQPSPAAHSSPFSNFLNATPCPECGIMLPPSAQARQMHLFSHFSEIQSQEFGCFQCQGVKFGSVEKLHQHLMELHSSCLYRCALCDETFESKLSLQVHFAVQHSSKKSSYRCKRCNACFYNDTDFEKHILKEHMTSTSGGGKIPHGSISPIFLPQFFPNRKNSPVGKSPASSECDRKLMCMFCGKVYNTEEQLQAHIYTHMKQFSCMYCDKVFHLSSLLEQHIKAFHLNELLASASKNSEQNLTETGRRPSVGGAAGHLVGSSKSDELLASMTMCHVPSENEGAYPSGTHGGIAQKVPPVLCNSICDVCNSNFPNELEMLKHKCGHLFMLNIPRCTLCNAVFGSSSNLAAHMFEHKVINVGNLCTFCNYPLSSEEHFFKHFDKHVLQSFANTSLLSPQIQNPDKKHVECIVCKQPLTSAAELQTHAKFHSHIDVTARGYRCSVCYQTFQTKTNLHCKVDGNGCPFYICGECKKTLQTHFPPPPVASPHPNINTHPYAHSQSSSSCGPGVDQTGLSSSGALHKNMLTPPSTFLPGAVSLASDLSDGVFAFYSAEVGANSRFHSKVSPNFPPDDYKNGQSGECEIKTGVNNNNSNEGCGQKSFLCSQCPMVLATMQEYVNHIAVHLMPRAPTSKTFQCIKCQKVFGSEKAIQDHVAQHLMEEGNQHDCKLCSLVFDTPGKLQCHLIEHSFNKTDGFICPVCHLVNKTARDLQVHVISHRDVPKPHNCSSCSQSFFFGAELEHHKKLLHSVDKQQLRKMSSTAVNHLSNITKNMATRSSSCDSLLIPSTAISNQSRMTTPPGNVTLEGGFKSGYRCLVCLRNFNTEANLRIHMKSHSAMETQLVKCSFCTEEFKSAEDLQTHFFLCHQGSLRGEKKPMFACDQCSAEFPCLSNLQGHMRSHTDGKKFPCNECGRVFSVARNLSIHIRSHKGEKPYACPICQKRFTRKENRKAHMKCHSGIKPYLCPHCGKMFSRKSHVRDHLKLHISMSSVASPSQSPEEGETSPVIKSEVLEPSLLDSCDGNHATSINDVIKSPVLSCALCSFTTSSLQDLKEHLSGEHTDDISFVTELNEIVESSIEDCDVSEDNEEEEVEFNSWDEMEMKPDVTNVMSKVKDVENNKQTSPGDCK